MIGSAHAQIPQTIKPALESLELGLTGAYDHVTKSHNHQNESVHGTTLLVETADDQSAAGDADKWTRGGILRESFVSNSRSLALAEDDDSHPSDPKSYSLGDVYLVWRL